MPDNGENSRSRDRDGYLIDARAIKYLLSRKTYACWMCRL